MAGNTNQVTGRVFVQLDGLRLRSKEGASLDTGGVERDPVNGDDGVHGFMEKTAVPAVECTISHMADTDVTALNKTTNATLHFTTDTGVNFILSGAWLVKPCKLSKGEIPLTFNALTCTEA